MTLREQLIRDEGLRLKPYRDTVGKLTIGIGRNLDDVGLSMAEAEHLLENDICRANSNVIARLPWAARMDEVRRAVLVNMAFNMGIGGLLGFKAALAAMEVGAWNTAASELLDSKWHEQVGIRAERLAEQVRTGEWQ